MKKFSKPTLVPTVLSQQGTLWMALLVGCFLVALWAYNLYDRAQALKAELARPVRSPAALARITVSTPPGWREYAVTNGWIEIRRTAGSKTPAIGVVCDEESEYAFRALDSNPALFQRKMAATLKECGIGDAGKIAVTGWERVQIKPGVHAIHVAFDSTAYDGEALYFYIGNTFFAVFGIAQEYDAAGFAEIRDFIHHLPDTARLPDARESIRRPVIDSSLITPKDNVAVQETVARELAMWRLFSARAVQEPDAALLPAIEHFRTALEKLSSVCEERNLIHTEDFDRYRKLLEIRAKTVKGWFVQLDKLIAMKNTEGAKRQARFILEHATLVDESLDARRASETLAQLTPPEQ